MSRRTLLTSTAATQAPSEIGNFDHVKSRENLVRNFPDLDPIRLTKSGLTPSSEMLTRRSSVYSVTR